MVKERMSDWGLITLLNKLYKILAKALALRIKLILPQLVKQEQFGFVHGRSIFDNILNVMGAIDYAREENFPLVVLNIDMDKAYDRIEWSYIEKVLDRMGFGLCLGRW